MDFDLSDDQKLLQETVASFANKTSPVTRFRKLRDDALGWEREVWKQMGDLGWLAVAFPESTGGYGGTFVDVAVILEKLGTTLVPEPFVPSVVLAGSAIQLAGSEEQAVRLLGPMLIGEASLALAYAEADGRYGLDSKTTAGRAGKDWLLSGEKVFVLNGHAAETIVVAAKAPEGLSLFAVAKDAAGLTTTSIGMLDGRRGANLKLEGVKAELLGESGSAEPVLEKVLDLGAAAACAEGSGLCQRVLDMTIEHLNLREQFGKKIGTFQVLQHATVDMFVEVQLIKSLALSAAVRVDAENATERKREISAAKAHVGTSAKLVTQASIQLHGGIGITDEHDVGLYFKRMHVLNTLFGDEVFHVQRFSALPSFQPD